MVLAVEPVEKIVPIRTLVLVGRIFQPQSCTPGMKRRQEHNFSQGGELCVVWSSCRGGVVVRSSLWQMCLGSWCLPSGVARGVLSNRIATGVCGIAPAAPPGSRAGGVPRSSTRLWQMCLRPWGLPRGVARGVLSNRITTGVRGTAPAHPSDSRAGASHVPDAPATRGWRAATAEGWWPARRDLRVTGANVHHVHGAAPMRSR